MITRGWPLDKALEVYIEKVEGGCWLWQGHIQKGGYGMFRSKLAHRVAYQVWVGEIPDGLQLDHLCRVRNCVNPAHLEPVTQKENWHRGVAPSTRYAIATHCIYGHPFEGDNLRTYSLQNPPRKMRMCAACSSRRSAEYRHRRQSQVD